MVLDIIVVAIIATLVIVGMCSGAIKTLFNLIGVLVAIIGAFILGNALSVWVYSTFFKPSILDGINSSIEQNGATQAIDNIINSIPDYIYNALSVTGVTKQSLLSDTQSMADTAQGSIAGSIEMVIGPIITSIISFFVIILLFLLLMIAIKFLVRIINLAFQLPILHTVNRALGAVLGFFEGVAVVYLLILLVKIILPSLGDEFFINRQMIDESVLFKAFYSFQLFM